MAGTNKAESNKRNASKSTGPITAAGKATASKNATTHGLLSRNLIIQGEDPADFQVLMQQLQSELQPEGILELALVERIAVGLWRQRRLVAAESGQLQLQHMIGEEQLSQAMSAAGIKETRRFWAREFAKNTQNVEYVETVAKELANALAKSNLADLKSDCPILWRQLLRQTKELDGPDHTALIARILDYFENSQQKYVQWLKEMQVECVHNQRMLAALALVRQAALIPSKSDVLTRYQSALDNDVYKATRALREAQKFRRDNAVLNAKPINSENE